MYGIFTYIWLIFMVSVGKYTIQEAMEYVLSHPPVIPNVRIGVFLEPLKAEPKRLRCLEVLSHGSSQGMTGCLGTVSYSQYS